MTVNHPRFTRLYVLGQDYLERVIGDIRKQQNIRARGRTLIVGAGTGLDIPVLGSDVTEVVLLEPDANMRDYLSIKYPDFPVLTSSAEQMDLDEQQVDTVISSLVLCSVIEVQQTFVKFIEYSILEVSIYSWNT